MIGRKFKNYLYFNLDLLIAAIIATIVGDLVIGIYEQYNRNVIAISVLNLVIEYGISIPAFLGLLFITYRDRYRDQVTGKIDIVKMKKDLYGLLHALGISEIIFLIALFSAPYLIVKINLGTGSDAFVAGSVVAWIIYFISLNALIRHKKIFNKT